MAVTLKPVASGRATFLDSPRCDDLDRLDAHVAVIGVPYGMASYSLNRSAICSTAPQAMREQSLRYRLADRVCSLCRRVPWLPAALKRLGRLLAGGARGPLPGFG